MFPVYFLFQTVSLKFVFQELLCLDVYCATQAWSGMLSAILQPHVLCLAGLLTGLCNAFFLN